MQIFLVETPQSVEKQDLFFRDFIHEMTITGSWFNEVRKLAKRVVDDLGS